MNKRGTYLISFRVNVYRDDPITKKIQLIRKSAFADGNTINLLLTEFEHENSSYLHYILIDNYSFLRKDAEVRAQVACRLPMQGIVIFPWTIL